jgi:hypothetical protein
MDRTCFHHIGLEVDVELERKKSSLTISVSIVDDAS